MKKLIIALFAALVVFGCASDNADEKCLAVYGEAVYNGNCEYEAQ